MKTVESLLHHTHSHLPHNVHGGGGGVCTQEQIPQPHTE